MVILLLLFSVIVQKKPEEGNPPSGIRKPSDAHAVQQPFGQILQQVDVPLADIVKCALYVGQVLQFAGHRREPHPLAEHNQVISPGVLGKRHIVVDFFDNLHSQPVPHASVDLQKKRTPTCLTIQLSSDADQSFRDAAA